MGIANNKYKVGDVVKVRSDLSEEHGATRLMIRKWAGKTVTIESTEVKTFLGTMPFYSVVGAEGYAWGDDMFEGLANATEELPKEMPKLTNGMFGVDEEGTAFVVVNDILVYQDGMLDRLGDEIECPANFIATLYKCECFRDIEDGSAEVIWENPIFKTEEADEVNEVKEDTEPDCPPIPAEFREMFVEALAKAIGDAVK